MQRPSRNTTRSASGGHGVGQQRGLRRPVPTVAIVAACVLVAAGCGTRLSHAEILAQNVTQSRGDRAAATGEVGGGSAASGVNEAEPPAGSVGGAASTAGGRAASEGTAGPPKAAAATAGNKEPLRIATVGWYSGIAGATTAPMRDVLVSWSKAVNAKGGINGHPVELYVADDGGNEGRSVSIVRDFVENKHIVALVNYAPGSANGVANYMKTKNVPVIGGVVTDAVWHQNPMMFPTATGTEGHYWGSAKLLADSGVKKVGTVFCTETTSCQYSNDTFVKYAKEVGLDVVYQGRISFTQPDYTAECLQMRNAGAAAIVPVTESSSEVRMAQSCGRQGYRPTWVHSTASDQFATIPEFDGSVASLISFPWFARSGAGIDEYVQALQKYAPKLLDGGVDFQSAAWVAGKTFERAAANVSDHPTAQEILEGLWSMRNESLGGLLVARTQRTFNRGQPTPDTFCVYLARVEGGKWSAPNGTTPVCR